MFRNEHKRVLCPGVLKTKANSLDQGKTLHSYLRSQYWLGQEATEQQDCQRFSQRDPENKTAVVELDKLPRIPGDLEGHAYVQDCTPAQGTREGPSYLHFPG